MIKSASRSELMSLIAAVVKEHHALLPAQQAEIFKTLITREGYEEYLSAALDRVWAMDRIRVEKSLFPPSSAEMEAAAAERVERRVEAKAAEDREVEAVKGIIAGRLLDLMTGVGKPLRECTDRECTNLGGFYAKIGAIVGADKLVGETLSERNVREIALSKGLPSNDRPKSRSHGASTHQDEEIALR